MAERFDDGLVFLKSVERGKCFIEYIPAENAWNPILADGYMYIDCLWVSGSFKGHGYSNDLLGASFAARSFAYHSRIDFFPGAREHMGAYFETAAPAIAAALRAARPEPGLFAFNG